jgi:Flp pilus assembly protein TadB
MAQTKRKRRSKHRGTAAGTIEARGRTSRPLTADERKKQARADARQRRLNTPPTWKGSVQRAGFAAVAMFVLLGVMGAHVKDRWVSAAFFAVIAMLLYVPAGYYLERFMWRRRQQKKLEGK